MISSKTAFTYEIDDVDAAVNDILSQLEPLKLTKEMIGIVECSYDYIETGVVKALRDALPFDLVGETTISQAVVGESGILMLTLMVLYSDDCAFAGGLTEKLPETGDMRGIIEKSYRETSARLDGDVKLILVFAPLINTQSGDDYTNILSDISDNTPVFGSVCADDNIGVYDGANVVYNGDGLRDRMAYILISGNISPEFKIVSVSNESIMPYKGEITDADNTILKGINGMSTVEYLETIGLASDGKIRSGINSIPFLINIKSENGIDEIAVARVLFAITPDNYAVCGGRMPTGSGITIGICDEKDVIATTEATVNDIAENFGGRTVLMHSCLGRRFALDVKPLTEMQIAVEGMSKTNSFMLSYSSGEFCPIPVSGNKLANRFHNYTFVACVL